MIEMTKKIIYKIYSDIVNQKTTTINLEKQPFYIARNDYIEMIVHDRFKDINKISIGFNHIDHCVTIKELQHK